jgi:hypothetical protein
MRDRHGEGTVMLSGIPRSTSRAAYKALHRFARQVARIQEEAATDMLIFGTGFVEVQDWGIRSVPPEDVVIVLPPQQEPRHAV